MKVLIACELSGVVRDAFREKGHDAWSCDLFPCDGDNTYHFQQDVTEIIYDDCWDLLIAHPPCTYLANSGVHWLNRQPGRWKKMVDAAVFFRLFLCADIPKICVENPVIHGYAMEHIGQKYAQTIQPYQFGHPESKRTCLWLKGLPMLKPTNVLPKPECGYWDNQCPSGQNKLGPSPDRAKVRSKTYKGIAEGMASQWGTNKLYLGTTQRIIQYEEER